MQLCHAPVTDARRKHSIRRAKLAMMLVFTTPKQEHGTNYKPVRLACVMVMLKYSEAYGEKNVTYFK